MEMPKRRLSNEPEDMLKTEANVAPPNDPNVDPKLFIDMKRANKVPSIPGGQSCPDKIRNGINLQWMKDIQQITRQKMVKISKNYLMGKNEMVKLEFID